MVEGTSRMQHLISELLQYARVTTNAQPFMSVDLDEVRENVLSDLRMATYGKCAYISYYSLPSIAADPVQIRQLFQYLIWNAIKFKGDKNPEVYIKAERINNEWLFSVEDNGIGLALCKKIVERHGGRMG